MRRMIDFLAIGLALALTALVPSAGRAEDLKFGAYDEFTLYNSEGTTLKDDVLFLFHGFASAMPNGAYKSMYREFSPRYSVIGFNYDYFDLDANDRVMELVRKRVLEGRNVVFGGSSLGGFMANYYAEKYGVGQVVMVNPVVDPPTQLRQFLGRIVVEKRRKEIEVTEEELNRYRNRVADAVPGIRRLVILSRDDETLDYSLAERKFTGPGNQVVIFDDGGHTPDLNQQRYVDLLSGFLQLPDK